MTQFLPPNLLALFAPRDPIPFLPPADKLPCQKKHNQPYTGIASNIKEFEDPKDTPPPTRVETKDERKERKRKERAEQVAYKLEQDLALWDPPNDSNIHGDPFKSLFIARINYDTSESKLRREFEVYGPVKHITLTTNRKNGKPRGYAFIEYEHERDMHSAYKHADGKKIDGRRVLVDVERGRTVKGWRPRRLGGGMGGTRKGGPDVNTKYSGRDDNFGRERSRSRERGRRSRSRSPAVFERERERERPERRRRRSKSKSRERPPRRRRSKSRDRDRKRAGDDDDARKRSRRSRSRERRRSKSRDRKRRRSRSRDRKRSIERVEMVPPENTEPMEGENFDPEFVQIKQEPANNYEGTYEHQGPPMPDQFNGEDHKVPKDELETNDYGTYEGDQ